MLQNKIEKKQKQNLWEVLMVVEVSAFPVDDRY